MNKDKAKEELQKKIRRNIKLVLKIIAILIIVIAVTNFFWQKFREEIYEDKEKIIQMNQVLVQEGLDSLENLNTLMKGLIYEVKPEAYLLEQRFLYYDQLLRLTEFRYNYKDYQIDTWKLRDIIYNEREAIEYALNQQRLSPEAKEGLANLIIFNQHIIDDIHGIQKEYIYQEKDDDKKKTIQYLYFYEGELFYLLYNAMETYKAHIDFGFIQYDDTQELIRDTHIDRVASEDDFYYLSILSQWVYGETVEFALNTQESSYEEGEVDTSLKRYETVGEPEGSVSIYEHQTLDYSRNLRTEDIKDKPILTQDKVRRLADEFIQQLGMKTLTLDSARANVAVKIDGEFVEEGYYFSYMINEPHYLDQQAVINLGYHTSGTLSTISIGDMRLMDGQYNSEAIAKAFITKEEALKVMPHEAIEDVTGIWLDVTANPVYKVTVHAYEQEFVFIIDGMRKELLRVE